MAIPVITSNPHIQAANPVGGANPAPAPAAPAASTASTMTPAAENPGFFAQIKNAIFKCLSYLPFIGHWFAEATPAPAPAPANVFDDNKKLDELIKPMFATAAPSAELVASGLTTFESFATLEGKLKALQFIMDAPHATPEVVKQFFAKLPVADRNKLDGLTWEKSHAVQAQRPDGLKFETDPKSAHAKAAVAAYLAQAQALSDATKRDVITKNYLNPVADDVKAAAISMFAGMRSRVEQLKTIDALMKSQHTTPAVVKEFLAQMPQVNRDRLNWHAWEQSHTDVAQRQQGHDVMNNYVKDAIAQRAVVAYVAELIAAGQV